jgi:hypothetical protein
MTYFTLGKLDPDAALRQGTAITHPEEIKAAHERIDELKASLAEMIGIYWGDGDGIDPPPSCIVRAQAALAEGVL